MASGDDNSNTSNAADVQTQLTPAQSELLTFVKQKCKIMAVDDLTKVCVDFYCEEEIFAAKGMVEQVITYRLPKRQGANRIRNTVEDLVKLCLDPNVTLPLYYAVDLHRLPPVNMKH